MLVFRHMQKTNIFIHKNLGKEVYYLILGLASVSAKENKREKKTRIEEMKRKEERLLMCCAPFTCAWHWNFPFSSSWHWPHLRRQFHQQGKQVSDTYSTHVYRILNNWTARWRWSWRNMIWMIIVDSVVLTTGIIILCNKINIVTTVAFEQG